MTNTEKITALAQRIYLARNGRYNDVDGTELTAFLEETVDWVNQFVPELELEADWNYLRTRGNLIGTVTDLEEQAYDLPETVRKVVVSPYRDVTISHDGAVVSTFTMVNPDQISDPTNPEVHDRATVINRRLVLSRPLKDTELNGEIRADTIDYMPKLTMNSTVLLDKVEPEQLLVLGVAKNATLPDIVQGGISPSLTQKYGDLLEKAVAANNATADVLDIQSEDFSFVRGVW